MIKETWWQLANLLANEWKGRRQRQVHFVTDSANWSFKWDAHYIATGLGQRLKDEVPILTTPWHLRHQVILFGNRYPWFFGPRQRLHRSNTLFLTWFHGDPADPDANMQAMFRQLPKALDPMAGVVVTCQISRDILLGCGVAAEKLITIPLGVDLQRFRPPTAEEKKRHRADMEIPDGVFCIGSFQKDGTGWGEGLTPKPVKGPDIFLETLARLTIPRNRLMVLLTGPARGYVKQGLERLGIPWRHRFVDDYLDMVPCYQALDAYLISSRAEGGPKALPESWACGVPVVSTRVGMPADLIQTGTNGLMAAIEDSHALAKALDSLFFQPELHQKLRLEGLNTVAQLDWTCVAEGYFHMINKYF
ncbi:MAG: Glycosyl transferase family 1 [Magnetococcales bacterium]|nr:Glycosyl transferase family 1 [Magnetococcales bacterium]HIJ82730.1 glycosyltransferase family 4 protein [Magnetococcales bacterium]